MELQKKEEAAFGDTIQEVMDHIGISEQEFMMMQQTYMSDQRTAMILMQAQMAPAVDESAPKLTKQKTKDIFKEQEE